MARGSIETKTKTFLVYKKMTSTRCEQNFHTSNI